MMFLSIQIHQKWSEAGKNVPKVILHEVRECSEQEFNKIRSDYESGRGKYGMKNTSLDHCHWIDEESAKHRMQFLERP